MKDMLFTNEKFENFIEMRDPFYLPQLAALVKVSIVNEGPKLVKLFSISYIEPAFDKYRTLLNHPVYQD